MRPTTSIARRALRLVPVCRNASIRYISSSPACQARAPTVRRAEALAAQPRSYSQNDTEAALNANVTGVKATLKEAHKQKALGMHPDHALQLIRTFCRVPKEPGYEPKFVAGPSLRPMNNFH